MKVHHVTATLLAIGLSLSGELLAQDIAYLQVSDGYWQAWVMNSDGSSPHQVTFSPGDKTRLSWYPDGQQLLINHTNGTLTRVDIITGKEENIPTKLVGMLDAVLSPDGSQIALSLSTGDSIDNNNIWLVDTANGNKNHLLTRMQRLQHEPIWSPDGQYIYFLSGAGGQVHDIWRARIADGNAEQLTVNALYHFDVAVSIDGILAFSSNRSGNYELWQWDITGSAKQLTHHPALDARPSWSPDAKFIVFESTRNGTQAIWKLNLDTGEATQLSAQGAFARFPVWRYGADTE